MENSSATRRRLLLLQNPAPRKKTPVDGREPSVNKLLLKASAANISLQDQEEAGPSETAEKVQELTPEQAVLLVRLAKRKFPNVFINLRQFKKLKPARDEALQDMSKCLSQFGIKRDVCQLENFFKNLRANIVKKSDLKGVTTGNPRPKKLTPAERSFAKVIDANGNNPILHLTPGAVAAGLPQASSSSASQAVNAVRSRNAAPDDDVFILDTMNEESDYDVEDDGSLEEALNIVCEDFEQDQMMQQIVRDVPELWDQPSVRFAHGVNPVINSAGGELELATSGQSTQGALPSSSHERPANGPSSMARGGGSAVQQPSALEAMAPGVAPSTPPPRRPRARRSGAQSQPASTGPRRLPTARGSGTTSQQSSSASRNPPAALPAVRRSGTGSGTASATLGSQVTTASNRRARTNFGEDLDHDELYLGDSDDNLTSQEAASPTGRRGRSRSPVTGRRNRALFDQQSALFDDLLAVAAKEMEVNTKKAENLTLEKSILQEVSRKAKAESDLAELNFKIRQAEVRRMTLDV